LKLLDKKDCTDSDLFFQALQKLNKLEPSAFTLIKSAKLKIVRGKFEEAAQDLQKALTMTEDENEKADIHYLLAGVYVQLKKYSQARSECYDVLKTRPNDGKVYIMIGDMYAASASDCGNDDLTKKVAYWPAVDMYIKAKNVDPSVEDLARSKINTFTQYFPAKELLFFHDLKDGDSYTVECWINVTTTVRSSD